MAVARVRDQVVVEAARAEMARGRGPVGFVAGDRRVGVGQVDLRAGRVDRHRADFAAFATPGRSTEVFVAAFVGEFGDEAGLVAPFEIVAVIGRDPEEALGVHRDRAPVGEAFPAPGRFGVVDLAQVAPGGAELDHAVLRRAEPGRGVRHVDVAGIWTVRVVDRDRDRAFELPRAGARDPGLAGARSAAYLEHAGAVADPVSPGLEEFPGGGEFHHPGVCRIGRVDVAARFVDGERRAGGTDVGLGPLPVTRAEPGPEFRRVCVAQGQPESRAGGTGQRQGNQKEGRGKDACTAKMRLAFQPHSDASPSVPVHRLSLPAFPSQVPASRTTISLFPLRPSPRRTRPLVALETGRV